MDKVLLVISDFTLRQLYHELLFSPGIEIVPIEQIATAILLLTVEEFTAVILYVVDESKELEVFLNLRGRYPRLNQVKIIMLVDSKDYHPALTDKDLVLSLQTASVEDIKEKIQSFL